MSGSCKAGVCSLGSCGGGRTTVGPVGGARGFLGSSLGVELRDLRSSLFLQKTTKNFLPKMTMTTTKAVAMMIITMTKGMLEAPFELKGPG